ncbi:hypothetical protein LTR62_002290 [Meristemomyces frigidus]|uniref:Mediator of RNA polymerase II transcription subunit 11 n=1 Tax=Meristemomyces frigidus TaxID=1508187 RepID=A0AAN7TL16_9PEZI|nr:hypothetical protein LTR62_002290 [Meristemomyces frigidus]
MAVQGIVTAADRIRELDEINGGLADMLNHMGQAIKALGPNAQAGSDDLDARKEVFQEHSRAAYVCTQAFHARMKRQVYALEEAGIILAQAHIHSATSSAKHKQANNQPVQGQGGAPPVPPASEAEHITNGGLGNLDVGWLNSRGNKVGMEKEAELLQEAKILLEDELERRRGPAASAG